MRKDGVLQAEVEIDLLARLLEAGDLCLRLRRVGVIKPIGGGLVAIPCEFYGRNGNAGVSIAGDVRGVALEGAHEECVGACERGEEGEKYGQQNDDRTH